ncbi:MAG: thiamine-phosphate kinase [Methylobacter sp.]|nr:thiamine-phosphate kinase [Methylobacter sp.]MDP2098126.1 thiamine-phosphate kinase [Methylobacter sp.]MDP2427416.1 thiamine-phosphate kinase [Methylobacter sp.]MDP3055988.1 thiamine-phosphate kinase [Methylobacter sp.]MDP3363327.1 thiamine-phosphate kinase [Methylobacter sp.]
MPLSEFSLIQRFFTKQQITNPSTRLGIGDDCALLSIPEGFELAITTDTMVENVHFFADADPELLGHKLLAVNLSDLAAMGAKPVSVTLALTLPKVDENWLAAFARGFLNLAGRYSVDLIGGDTTSGPLTLTVQAMGLVPKGRALMRSTARPGDFIYMTGALGDAGLGLKIRQGYDCTNPDAALARFNQPDPQIEAGLALNGIATACIDLSDGLAGDLGHILQQSRVGACLEWEALPLSTAVQSYIKDTGDWAMPLTAGDDYELCFTVSPEQAKHLTILATKIGIIESQSGLRLRKSSVIQPLEVKSFEHFS